MKKLLALLLCLSLVFALAACSTSESPAQQPAEQPTQTDNQPTEPAQTEQPAEPETPAYPIGQFTVGTTAAIETATFGEYNFDMLASGVSELPLVWQDAEGNYHPLLASYETEDSVTWIYTIEPGMTWSDGEPVKRRIFCLRSNMTMQTAVQTLSPKQTRTARSRKQNMLPMSFQTMKCRFP